jgi:flagellar hook-length control protein FliK
MESIPAATLPIAIAPDTQPARDGASGDAGEFSTFEQVLDKEISAANATTEQAAAAAGAALANSDLLAKSDTTRILDVILDSSGMLMSATASAGPAPVAAGQASVDVGIEMAGGGAVRGVHTPAHAVRKDGPAEVSEGVSQTASAAVDARTARPETTPVTSTVNLPAEGSDVIQETTQRTADAPSSAQPRGASAPAAAPVAPSDQAFEVMRALASAGRAPAAAAEMLPPADKTSPAKLTGEHSPPSAAFSSAPREELQARSILEEPIAQRFELRAERMPTEAAGTAATASPVIGEPTGAPREGLTALDTLSSAALMQRSTPASPMGPGSASAATAVVRIDTPLATQGWNEAFRQQVVWLVDRQLETAELHVNPPHLGPVEVVLKVADDGARIAFCSPHAAVREAIESSLAELRSSLAERGLSLGQALVSADPGSAREQMMREEKVPGAQRMSDAAHSTVESETRVLPLRRGLVDTFV